MEENNSLAHDVTLNRENFRARKMSEMERAEFQLNLFELKALRAKVAEMEAQLAARDAEIEKLKRNLELASEMMKEVESEPVNEDPNEERRRLAAAAAAVGAPPDYNPFIHPDAYNGDAPPPRIFTRTFSTNDGEHGQVVEVRATSPRGIGHAELEDDTQRIGAELKDRKRLFEGPPRK